MVIQQGQVQASDINVGTAMSLEALFNARIQETRAYLDQNGLPLNFGLFHKKLSPSMVFGLSTCQVSYPQTDSNGDLVLYNKKDAKIWLTFSLGEVIDWRTGKPIINASSVEVFIPRVEISKWEKYFGNVAEAGTFYLLAADSKVVRFSPLTRDNAAILLKSKGMALGDEPHVTVIERKDGLGLSYEDASFAKAVKTQVENKNNHYLTAAAASGPQAEKVSSFASALNALRDLMG